MICCCRYGEEWEEHRCHCEVVVPAADYARTSVSWLWEKEVHKTHICFIIPCVNLHIVGLGNQLCCLSVSLSVIKEYHSNLDLDGFTMHAFNSYDVQHLFFSCKHYNIDLMESSSMMY